VGERTISELALVPAAASSITRIANYQWRNWYIFAWHSPFCCVRPLANARPTQGRHSHRHAEVPVQAHQRQGNNRSAGHVRHRSTLNGSARYLTTLPQCLNHSARTAKEHVKVVGYSNSPGGTFPRLLALPISLDEPTHSVAVVH
jgi:hypothetical protein